MVGRSLGHYRILEKLGEGGMGVVYKARDSQLDRDVAIKILPPERLTSSDRKLRFIQEAKSASALNHPNIITIYEIGNQDGLDFIVMEFIAGRTLDHLIPPKGMKMPDLLQYSIHIADALARAHAAGIVHRDLKPGNIMIGDDGQVKLLDFGLAKLTELGDTGNADATRTVRPETEEGTIVGTVSYMSPEQAEGRRVDARSDIFSFGTVLYEMATGRRAFSGASRISILANILHEEPKPLAEIHPGVPRALEAIVHRTLRKDPGRRAQSAADLRVSLEDLAHSHESGVQPAASPAAAPPARRPRPLWPAVALLALAAGAAAGWWFGSRAQAPAPGPIKPLTTYRGSERYPALSPDGKQVAFSWDGEKEDNFDIYVRLVDGGSALRLTTDPAPDLYPAWSPDARRLAYIRGNAIYTIPALGGVEQRLVQFPQGRMGGGVSWSPDGKLLTFSGAESSGVPAIWVVSAEGGEPRRVTTARPARAGGQTSDVLPAFSPDGSRLAFIRALDLYSRAIIMQDMSGDSPVGNPRQLTSFESTTQSFDWTADGKSLVLAVTLASWSDLWRLPANGGALARLGIGGGGSLPSVSRTGHRLAYVRRQVNTDIFRVNGPGPDGGPQPFERVQLIPVIDSTASDLEPMFSPDGRRMLFNSDRWGTYEIHVADRDGSHQVALTRMGPTAMGSARWSPDGSTAVFDRYEHGHSSIFTVSTEGGKPRRMTGDDTSDIRPSYSRDGKWIYFISTRSGPEEVWKMPASGGAAQQVTHTGRSAYEAFESPDGKDLFYIDNGLWSLPVAGGEPKLVIPELRSADYALAGRSVYYWSRNPRAIWIYRLDSGRKFEYIRFPASVPPLNTGGTHLTVSADERTIMFPLRTRDESDLMLVENFR